jgi:hypothetical protein
MIGGADNVLRNVKIIKKRNSIYHREYMELLKKEKKEGNG